MNNKFINNYTNTLNDHSSEPKQTIKEQNFQIYLRVKPKLSENYDPEEIIKKIDNQKLEIVSPYYVDSEKTFQYDHIFDELVTNQILFQRTMTSPINNVLNGFNSTILIYGMTGAGKTYTMFGDKNMEYPDGIIFLTLANLFEIIRRESEYKTKLSLSFYQIYNQSIRDLLQQNAYNLNIQEDPIKGIIIQDLTQVILENQTSAKNHIQQGILRRAMNATKSNEVSSRSHAIFQLNFKRYKNNTNSDSQKCKVFQSKLFLIDLAGNEKSYTNTNKRFVEGVNINKSLLTLGKCINILAQQKKNQFVPFRDSKLTRILKQSLGGNAKTIMIACISSWKKYYEQTLNTLKYSSIAKNIKNKSIKNMRQINKSQLILSKNEFVDLKTQRSINQEQLQQRNSVVTQLLKNFMRNLQEKNKIQNIIKNLKQSKTQNQDIVSRRGLNDPKIKQSLRQIDYLLIEMQKQRIKNIEEGEKNYKLILIEINNKTKAETHPSDQNKIIKQQKKAIEAYRKEIQNYKKLIAQKDMMIEKLKYNQEQLNFQIKSKQSILKQTEKNEAVIIDGIDTISNNLKQNTLILKKLANQQNKVVKLLNTNRNISTKKIDICLNNSMNSHSVKQKQNINIMAHEEDKTINSFKHYLDKKPKEIMIDLNSNPLKRSKEQFIKQLKEAEANIRNPKIQKDIEKLLTVQQFNQFDLNPLQQSILKRLRMQIQRHNDSIMSNSSQRNILQNNSKDFKRSFSKKLMKPSTLK